MRLSKNFTLDELIRSDTAKKKGYVEQYTPPKEAIENLRRLVESVLQPARDRLGESITVTSGYRCDRLNKALGGAASSQHRFGQAADLVASSNAKLFEVLRSTPFDQLIWEFGDADQPAWVHVSYSERHRRQVLRAVKEGGKTVYRVFA
jgi:zinc D-Ala-D-Ala carboxypeptidase